MSRPVLCQPRYDGSYIDVDWSTNFLAVSVEYLIQEN